MRLKLVLTGIAVLAVTLLPTAASAGLDTGRGRFLSLPPDLTTGYLEGHHPHKDPKHPGNSYRQRPLRTATTGSTGSTASPSPSPPATCATST